MFSIVQRLFKVMLTPYRIEDKRKMCKMFLELFRIRNSERYGVDLVFFGNSKT